MLLLVVFAKIADTNQGIAKTPNILARGVAIALVQRD